MSRKSQPTHIMANADVDLSALSRKGTYTTSEKHSNKGVKIVNRDALRNVDEQGISYIKILSRFYRDQKNREECLDS